MTTKSKSKQRSPRSFDIEPIAANTSQDAPAVEASKPTSKQRKPKATPTSQAKVEPDTRDFFAMEAEAEIAEEAITEIEQAAPRRALSFFGIAKWAGGLLLTLALALWLESLWQTALERNDYLGWLMAGLIVVFAIGVFGFIIREWWAIRRLKRVSVMRERAQRALEDGDDIGLRRCAKELLTHFSRDPNTASGRADLASLSGAIIDAEDVYALHEKALLAGIDKQAVANVSAAAKRVSIVTAVSPRALVDVGYVLFETVRLIRVIAELYGGRAGALGTITLARRVISHLAVTGTISMGEGILQQALGHGIAARVSTRLGEGVINGIMTARVGIAAMDVCRPAPFHSLKRPSISDLVPKILPSRRGATDSDETAH